MITLSNSDKDDLIKRFPKIELCYESNIEHNKVCAKPDYYALISKGRKCLLWTTYFKEHLHITFKLDLYKGNIENIEHVIMPQIKELCFGTILYGTLFFKDHFCIETFHYYKGRKVEHFNSQQQLELAQQYMKYCYDTNDYKLSYKMGIPYMSVDINECIRMRNLVPYSVYCVQHRKYNWNHKKIQYSFIKDNNNIQRKEDYVSFEVRADVQNDVYNCYYGKNSEFYGVLYIPNIKTSIMMNKLYRNIKENKNLDALEESDDEEEFENINEDKFLLKNKVYIIDCAYNSKLRKWYPVQVSKNKCSVEQKPLIRQNVNLKKQDNYKKYRR